MELDRIRVAVAVALCVLGTSFGVAHAGGLTDKKPNSGVAAAHDMPIQGIDVSYFQGNVDWKKVGKAGIRFAYIKATEGADRFDPEFRDNWNGAKRAGVIRGAYHMMYWCSPASAQASWFLAHLPKDSDTLPPVLDLEWNGHSKTCPHKIARKSALAKIKVMLDAMEAHTGRRPIIYTDPKFHHDVLEGEFTEYQFWLRSVAAEPEEKYRGRDWSFWQFTTTGRVPGVTGAVDRNTYNGTPADWKRVQKRLQANGDGASAVPASDAQQ